MKTGDIFIREREAVRLIRQTSDSFYMCQKVELYQYYLQQIVKELKQLNSRHPGCTLQLIRYSKEGCLMDIIEGESIDSFLTSTSNPRMYIRKCIKNGVALEDTFEVIVVKDIK